MSRREIHLGRLFVAVAAPLAVALAIMYVVLAPQRVREPLVVIGGRFINNYRIAEVYMQLVVAPGRPLEIGTRLEIEFPDPSGGRPALVRRTLGIPDRRIETRGPPVRGVRAGTAYPVRLRLFARGADAPYWERTIDFVSNVDDDVVPESPLTVGPGYARPRAATVPPAPGPGRREAGTR